MLQITVSFPNITVCIFRTINENLRRHISILEKIDPKRLTTTLQGKIKHFLKILVETATKLASYIESF